MVRRLGIKTAVRGSSFASGYAGLLTSSLARSSGIVGVGNIMNAGLNFLTLSLLARFVGPSDYGVFAVASAVVLVLADMSGLGINPTLIRYAALYLQRGEIENARAVFSGALRMRTLVTLVLVAFGLVFSRPIAVLLLKNPKVVDLMPVTFLGLIPVVLMSYIAAVFQAYMQFKHFLVINTITGVSKLAGVIVLHLTGRLTPMSALMVFVASPVLSIAFGLVTMDPMALSLRKYVVPFQREFAFFSFWMAAWAVFAVLQGRLDLFMVTNMLGVHAAGLYSVAYQLAMAFTVCVGAVGTVLNPRLAGMTLDQLRRFSRFMVPAAVLVAVAVLIITGAGHLFIPRFLGKKYVEALPVFYVVMIGMFLFGCQVVPNGILNALGKPFIFSLTAALGLGMTFVANLIFLPRFGVVGVGYTFTSVTGMSAVISLVATRVYLGREGAGFLTKPQKELL